MKLRTLTLAAAGVMALGLAACQQKTEEAPAAPAAEADLTAPATDSMMAATPPAADASATTTDPAAPPPADATTTTTPPPQ
jgi:nitrous oxide reductase accessory protein NosL